MPHLIIEKPIFEWMKVNILNWIVGNYIYIPRKCIYKGSTLQDVIDNGIKISTIWKD